MVKLVSANRCKNALKSSNDSLYKNSICGIIEANKRKRLIIVAFYNTSILALWKNYFRMTEGDLSITRARGDLGRGL